MESKILQDALRSVREPIEKFIETGIYTNPWADEDIPDELRDSLGFVSEQQTQRVCRMVAKELKRPFIIVTPVISEYVWERVNGRYTSRKTERTFQRAHIKMPRRKYLMPLVSPLILAESGPTGPVRHIHEHSNWYFHITNEALWNDYRAALDRPEMRAARKLPPL